ncbi:MAG: ACP S-malonyltransferase, partial [Alistipes sp.]|nr:ACP S-malonyltransferase [Alistipes sp.]
MKKAYVFPGQGAQYVGMGKDLYENNAEVRALFERANEVLGFRITDLMFAGTPEDLRQTKVTQPAVFLHSVALAKALQVTPDAVAGHSLGEFSALVVAGALSFEEGLKLVSKRAQAMQACCEAVPGTMAAVISLADAEVEQIIQQTLYDAQDTIPVPPLPDQFQEKEKDMEEDEEETEPPLPKGRPKRKKGYGLLGIPHILST